MKIIIDTTDMTVNVYADKNIDAHKAHTAIKKALKHILSTPNIEVALHLPLQKDEAVETSKQLASLKPNIN